MGNQEGFVLRPRAPDQSQVRSVQPGGIDPAVCRSLPLACPAAFKYDNNEQALSGRRERHDGRAISLSVSIGIAPLGDRAKSATELIARADEKLYEAKRKGGNLCRL